MSENLEKLRAHIEVLKTAPMFSKPAQAEKVLIELLAVLEGLEAQAIVVHAMAASAIRLSREKGEHYGKG